MPVAGFVLRASSRLAVDAGRLSVRAIPRTLMPAFRQSAMLMRSSWLRYLELIFWGMSTVERYQSTDGFSFLPFDRVLPLRHTLPVRLDTPTARAACVKFMPASRCSTYRRRRAAHISPRVAYSTPSNTHLSTWPSHQSARRCDDHWNPPTTLMKTLLGRIKPVSGEVTYTGTNINEMSAAIDHPSFFPYLSGRENVEVVSAFWGLDVDPEAALDGVGINRAAYGRKAKDYSTGMKERLELCLALVPHPRFLFLDEPQNGLDPDGIASLSETLRAYRDKGNCVVISTHLLHEIQGVPDECIMIRHGRAVRVTDLTGVNLADLYQGR